MFQDIDVGIIKYLNGFATKSALFDDFYVRILQLPSVKFLPLTACIVWLWFDGHSPRRRSALVRAILGAFVAIVVSRLIQNLSPHRPRPLNMESLNFVLPFPLPPDQVTRWNDWSSFPSDTAALGFALATGIWQASRPVGWGCLFWAAFVISLPRVYAGFHYPSDIVGGAILGTLSTLAVIMIVSDASIMKGLDVLERRSKALLYSASFVLLFYVTTIFDDVRSAITELVKLL
jgi:undecaprenyl-diphosphatase